MTVILGIRETIEHLQTDEVQVPQPVAISTRLTCNSVLRRIKHQTITICFVFNMLHFQNNTFQTLIFGHNIRGCCLDKGPIYCRIHKSEVVNAISAIQLENGIQKTCRHPHVFWISKQHFENGIVVDIDVFIFFTILHNALVDIASDLMDFADGAEHFRVLFPVHKTSFVELFADSL